jgi:hypothetical protein
MTARISTSDGRLVIHRTGVGRWFGSSLDVPLAHVISVDVADPADTRRWVKGIRLAGIEIPRLRAAGLYRQGPDLVWWDVGRGDQAVVIAFRDERLARAIVEVDDPAGVKAALEQATA